MKRIVDQLRPLPTDTRRVRRMVWARNWVWLTLGACVVVGTVCDALMPASWKGGKGVSGGSGPWAMVRNPTTGQLLDVTSSVTVWAETFLGVNVGTRVEVSVSESAVPPGDVRDPAMVVTLDQAMADIRDACERRCEAVGDRGAAVLFDQALAAGGGVRRSGTVRGGRGEATVWHPWRYAVASVRALAWGGMCAMMTFGLLVPLVLEVVIKRARKAQSPVKCGECGYDLAGLGEGIACPECGAGRVGAV